MLFNICLFLSLRGTKKFSKTIISDLLFNFLSQFRIQIYAERILSDPIEQKTVHYTSPHYTFHSSQDFISRKYITVKRAPLGYSIFQNTIKINSSSGNVKCICILLKPLALSALVHYITRSLVTSHTQWRTYISSRKTNISPKHHNNFLYLFLFAC